MASDIPAADAAELYNQRLTIGVVVTCLSLSLITFTLRIYARVVTSAKLWWDDYWMFLVMVLCLAMSAADFVGMSSEVSYSHPPTNSDIISRTRLWLWSPPS